MKLRGVLSSRRQTGTRSLLVLSFLWAAGSALAATYSPEPYKTYNGGTSVVATASNPNTTRMDIYWRPYTGGSPISQNLGCSGTTCATGSITPLPGYEDNGWG